MNDENKLLVARGADIISRAEKYCTPQFGQFVNEAQRAVLETNFPYAEGVVFYGGYSDAERTVMGVFPYGEDLDEFPISVVEIVNRGKRELSHRDVLGTVLSLGLKREKLGDIRFVDGRIILFCMEDIAVYITENLKKIANCGVFARVGEYNSEEFEYKYEEFGALAASERADAVIAAILNVSRNEAQALIERGLVLADHRMLSKPDQRLSVGTLLSVRGHGRFIIDSTGGKTRSGRLHYNIKKYI